MASLPELKLEPRLSEFTSAHCQSYQAINGPIAQKCYCAVTHRGSDARNIAKKTVSFLLTAENSVPVYALCTNKEYGRDRRFFIIARKASNYFYFVASKHGATAPTQRLHFERQRHF
jgi:hypothetical protein